MEEIKVLVADETHEKYVDIILDTISEAAKVRGTGIARRTHEYLATKIKEAKAVIALCGDEFAGFSYIETWGNKQYVTTSGLIVHPKYRGITLAAGEDFLADKRCGRDADEHPAGVQTRDVCRAD